jgi:hypothetical protein
MVALTVFHTCPGVTLVFNAACRFAVHVLGLAMKKSTRCKLFVVVFRKIQYGNAMTA